MGPKKLELRYGLEFKRAKGLLQALDHLYRGTVEFWAKQVSEARSEGFLTNRYGRRRDFPILVEEEASGFLVKSTAADLLFEAQRSVSERLGEGHLLAVGESATLAEGPDREELTDALRSAFKPVFKSFPLVIRTGKNWGEME